MADVKKKIRIRAGHRGYTRKVISAAREIVDSDVPFNGKKLRSLQATLKDKLAELKVLDKEIVELLEDETKIDQEISDSCEFASCIHDCVEDIGVVLSAAEKAEQGNQDDLPHHAAPNGTPASQSSSTAKHSHAKLPKLELKKFSGNPTDWPSFWDSFESAIHHNSVLADVDKFNYFKSLVQGQASETISGFSLTSDNYNEAIKLLKERFGNKQVLISGHMESLLKLPAVTSISEIKKLRLIYDKLESNVRSLHNICVEAKSVSSDHVQNPRGTENCNHQESRV